MSSKSKEGQSSGGFHQEYIASLRYRNDLPPPEMPPKFLDIPHEGLSRFLTPGFASNLARREEPNVDVDAEGGMPIDLVGIPGLHLGDESGKSARSMDSDGNGWSLTELCCSYHGTRASTSSRRG
jgi:RNA polymerase II-associated factor 1